MDAARDILSVHARKPHSHALPKKHTLPVLTRVFFRRRLLCANAFPERALWLLIHTRCSTPCAFC